MKYINPYEIASSIHFNNLDTPTFKKFKRRLSAELELGDDEIIINSVKLHQNEIYELIDSIERDKNLLNIFKSLYKNKELNNFLNGKSNKNIKRLKNILSLEDKQTIDFITDYLIQILSKIYKEAFDSKYQVDTLQIKPPLDEKYYEKIYEPIYKILKNKENELISLKDDYYDLDDIKNIIGNIKTINILPEYFTKIRSDIAYAIRNLSIDSWNNNEDLDLAIDLINYALKFKVNNKTKDKFLSDRNDLEKIKEEQELIKFLDKIDNILNDSSIIFSSKIDKIIDILKQKNSKIENGNVALMVYNLINKYIEKNKTIILLYFSDLKRIFIYLKRFSLDIKLENALDENIQAIRLIEEGIQKNKEDKYAKYGMFIGGFIGLVGGFIGLIIGAIVGSILGRIVAK